MYLVFYQKYSCKAKYPAGYLAGYPALTGYPAGYPIFGFWISRISGWPDIRCIPKKYGTISTGILQYRAKSSTVSV
jgi:hypothetical protein